MLDRMTRIDNIVFHSIEASPQTDENRTERSSPQRRREHRDEVSFFFAAERPAKKNAHALPSGLEAGQGLTEGKNSRGALGLSFFCPLPAIASSGEAGGSQQKREKCFPLRSLRL